MLGISRRCGQKIFITAPDGTRIELQILRFQGYSVRIGITAPIAYVIDREEIHDRKEHEKRVFEDDSFGNR